MSGDLDSSGEYGRVEKTSSDYKRRAAAVAETEYASGR